jgi:hypothetical protein
MIRKALILVAALSLATAAPAAGPAKKPPAGEFFVAVSANYVDALGIGGGVGYQFKESGVFLFGQLTYSYFNGVSGTVPYTVGCRTYQVPFEASRKGDAGYEFTVAIPLRKIARRH